MFLILLVRSFFSPLPSSWALAWLYGSPFCVPVSAMVYCACVCAWVRAVRCLVKTPRERVCRFSYGKRVLSDINEETMSFYGKSFRPKPNKKDVKLECLTSCLFKNSNTE